MRLFNKVSIVGVGLIGGSIGMAIKKRHIACEVIGICRRRKNIIEAKKRHVIDRGFLDLKYIKDSDLVILATPVHQIIETIPKINQFIKKDCTVIDVGGTKKEVIKTAEKFLAKNICFVGTHPLAGLEKKGVEYACADLFNNSLSILTPCKRTNKIGLKKIEAFWKALGAKTKIMSASDHDRVISFSSHLAHIVAFSLVDSIPKEAYEFISTGFKDTTRIALSDALLWQDIFLSNAKNVIKAVDRFQQSLDKIKGLVVKKDKRHLVKLIEKIRQKRYALCNTLSIK